MTLTVIPSQITRSADHRYTYEGVTYPGVTTILGALDKSGPLMGWAAKETAKAAIGMLVKRDSGDPAVPVKWDAEPLVTMLSSVGESGTISALTARKNWQRDEAAQLGTDVHALADLIVQGKPLPDTITDTQRVRAEHYAEWWKASGWTLRLAEAMVVRPSVDHEEQGWGGTFDLLAYDADKRTVLADVKTGKAVYKETVLQLAAYSMASIVQPVLMGRTYPMPMVDRYVVLHVTEKGVREVEINVGQRERMAFLACLELHHWINAMKGLKF